MGGDAHGALKRGETSTAEWALAGACALLLAAVIAFLLYDGLHAPMTPPDPVVQVDSVARTAGGYQVLLRVHNGGRSTAAQLRVEGELRQGTTVVERAEATLDYVPAEGSRRAGLLFSHDPRRHEMTVRATGYDLP